MYLAAPFVYPQTISSYGWLYDDVCEARVVRGARPMVGWRLASLVGLNVTRPIFSVTICRTPLDGRV